METVGGVLGASVCIQDGASLLFGSCTGLRVPAAWQHSSRGAARLSGLLKDPGEGVRDHVHGGGNPRSRDHLLAIMSTAELRRLAQHRGFRDYVGLRRNELLARLQA